MSPHSVLDHVITVLAQSDRKQTNLYWEITNQIILFCDFLNRASRSLALSPRTASGSKY